MSRVADFRKIVTTIIAAIVAAIAVLVVIMLIAFHFEPLCDEETRSEQVSPDGRYVAVEMVRNCGATTDYVTHVNLRSEESNFKAGFFDGTIKDGEISTIGHRDGGERFCWLSSRQLNIEYPTPESEMAARHAWRDVAVEYGKKCP
jgi:hypothetical protein